MGNSQIWKSKKSKLKRFRKFERLGTVIESTLLSSVRRCDLGGLCVPCKMTQIAHHRPLFHHVNPRMLPVSLSSPNFPKSRIHNRFLPTRKRSHILRHARQCHDLCDIAVRGEYECGVVNLRSSIVDSISSILNYVNCAQQRPLIYPNNCQHVVASIYILSLLSYRVKYRQCRRVVKKIQRLVMQYKVRDAP